jgi:hypothetical protein
MLLKGQHIYMKFYYKMKTAKEMRQHSSQGKSESSPVLKKLNSRWNMKSMLFVVYCQVFVHYKFTPRGQAV